MNADDSLLGQQLDEYRLEQLLGHGGMARVYRGLDTRLERYVAIKVIDTPLRTDSEYARRFEREAQAIGRLDHPNIVRLYRYGEAQGVLYMAMQYIEGADLGTVLNDYRADGEFIEPEEAVRIVRQVCDALDYAHSQGVVHRDVKPSNVMLDKQGRAILTDFGLVLLTEIGTRGEIFGSPHYIAPEQAISSAGAVPQSDIYSVGIMLYEMFTGELPYDAENPMDIAMMHMEGNITPPRALRPDLSPELEAVILRTLARDLNQRYGSGAALASDLERTVQMERDSAAAPTRQRMSVPDRVAIELEAHPLPPLPAEVTPSAQPLTRPVQVPPPISAPPPVPVTRPRRKTSPSLVMLSGIGMAAAVLLAGLILGVYLLLGGGSSKSGPTPTVWATAVSASGDEITATQAAAVVPSPSQTPQPTFTAFVLPTLPFVPVNTAAFPPTPIPTLVPSRTPTPLPTWTPASTLTPMLTASPTALPTLTPVPQTENPASYALLIAHIGGDNVLIVNITVGSSFPLKPLQLGDGPSAVMGSEWGIDTLQSGQCISLARGNHVPPTPDVVCERVGTGVIRKPDTGFTMSPLTVYYQNKPVNTCQSERCIVQILVSTLANTPPVPTSYQLLIVKNKEDSLFVVNQSAETFPLALLSLGEGNGAINGAEWNLDLLAPGECVTAWKDTGKPKAPQVTCDQVGERLTRQGKQRFWKSAFPVYFQGLQVATCDHDSCLIQIPK